MSDQPKTKLRGAMDELHDLLDNWTKKHAKLGLNWRPLSWVTYGGEGSSIIEIRRRRTGNGGSNE